MFHSVLKVICVSLVFVGCAFSQVLTEIDKRSLKGKITDDTSPILIEVLKDGRFKYANDVMDAAELSKAIDEKMDTRMPLERVVSVMVASDVPFSRVVDLLLLGRAWDVDDFSFAPPNSTAATFDSKAAAATKIVLYEPEPTRPKPGPRFLGVELADNGSVLLNGKMYSESGLPERLKSTFATRRRNRIYVIGSRRVEKTVFVRVRKSTSYQDFWRVLQVVAKSGAHPIAVEIDWLEP